MSNGNIIDKSEFITTNDPVAYHNSIYRDLNIETKYTMDEISKRISSGTFDDLYVGDYFKKIINGETKFFRIAGFDLYIGTGDQYLGTHHAVVISDPVLSSSEMDLTIGHAYSQTVMYKTTLPTWLGYIKEAFGENHILKYRQLFTTKFDLETNKTSGFGWFDCELSLMSEINVYGSVVFSSSGYDVGIDNMQFPIFKLKPSMRINGNKHYWLKSVSNARQFCYVGETGYADHYDSINQLNVKPFFLLY